MVVNTAAGKPLSTREAQSFEAVEGADIVGAFAEETRESMGEPLKKAITDRIVLYHPDPRNPSSVYLVPMNADDRREVLSKLLMVQKEINGKLVRWNNTTPQVEPQALTLRCFIANCGRAGGFATRVDLIAHVMGKHANEVPLYQTLIDRLMKEVHRDIPIEQYEALGLEPPDKDGK